MPATAFEGIYPGKDQVDAASLIQRRYQNRKANRLMKSRFKNKKVTKKLVHSRRAPVKTIAKGNKSAILALSRQVRDLQLAKFGNKLYQTQSVLLDHTQINETLSVYNPIAFMVNSFYDRTQVYRGVVSSPGGIPSFTAPKYFSKQTYDTDLQDQYQWNETMNASTVVSQVEYLPVSAKHKITFKGFLVPSNEIVRFRVTLFRLRRVPPASNQKQLDLPGTLGAYWHMCENDAAQRNYFSKSYHRVIFDKWITLVAPFQENTHGPIENIYKTIEIPHVFTSMNTIKMNKTSTPSDQQPWTNLPEDQQIWCLISSSAGTAQQDAPPISVQIERKLCWRQRHGVLSAGPVE